MLQIENVRKTFNETVVLQEVSLSCEYGKIYGIVGRNGSGKSVLFKCICGFLEVDSGEIVLDGQVLSKGKIGEKKIGLIIENPAFLPQYSGFQNLSMLYSINNKMDTQIIKRYMNMVGLDPDDTKKVKKYSMGMKQRLAIAQAIMESPQLLILDEPFNGLDKGGIDHIRKLLLELKDTTIVLLASHNREDINLLCDETFELSEGLLRPLKRGNYGYL